MSGVQGKLCTEDSFIFLHTHKVEGLHKVQEIKHTVYYWRGLSASTDQYEQAMPKLLELEIALGGGMEQSNESQGFETEGFLAMFPKGLQYILGGYESGFEKKMGMMQTIDQHRLFECKGMRSVVVMQVAVSPQSVSSGDCYVYQKTVANMPPKIFVWNGSSVRSMPCTAGSAMPARVP